ncbi:hypothetical protein 1 [Beihai tombus-like virus 15]|uniref:hypothetical protein 1 n=1 Tax=Beihai tombus-like virus 15 TaxID=1922718 RepID=UPI00090C3332|nr:hypothetical protein 1 [Beihai tombus-like virus 15]APG76107.1 hypothetical protein 1 [Beihai tombus-like virus 15]
MALNLKTNSFVLDTEQERALARWGFNLKSGTIPHTHPVSALIRNGFEDAVINQHKDKRIKDVGGNYARHAARHQGFDIHSCCPLLSPDDLIREVTRDMAVDPDCCRKRFQDCSRPADVYMFNHSMYYVEPEDLACIPVGACIYSLHHLYQGPGTYCAGEMEVTQDEQGVYTVDTRGNNRPYKHKQCWLTGSCVIPGKDGAVIAFTVLRNYESAHVFKGYVYKVEDSYRLLSQPVFKPYDIYPSELEDILINEGTSQTIDNRTLHNMASRARTYALTTHRKMPANIADIYASAANKAAEINIKTQSQLNKEKIETSNRLIAGLEIDTSQPHIPIYRRVGGILWTLASGVVRTTAYTSLDYMKAGALLPAKAIIYTTSRIRQCLTYENNDYVVPTCTFVPLNSWENELTSILLRAVPDTVTTTIDNKIMESADKLAKLIGYVDAPMHFDEWVERYPPARQEQLRKAHYKPLNHNVDMFIKIEQLDDQKHPRAIQARHDSYKSKLGPWVARLEKRCIEALPNFVKKLNDEQRAEKVAELKCKADNIIEIDFTRFDRNCTKELLSATEHYIYDKVFPKEIASLLHLQLRNKVRSARGYTYSVEGTRMSGDVNTSIGNCLIVLCLSLAAGLELENILVEGDDMIAAASDITLQKFSDEVIKATGMIPKTVVTHRGGSFCSRYDVIDSEGKPRRVRHPLRDITRYGYTLHGEDRLERAQRHYKEWVGVPMLGPVYTNILKQLQPDVQIPEIEITAEARVSFARTFDISIKTQQLFEEDKSQRARIYNDLTQEKIYKTALTEAVETPIIGPGDSVSQISGTPGSSETGHDKLQVPTWNIRTGSLGSTSKNVRDVQVKGPSESGLQNSLRDDNKRGNTHRNRLRRHRRQARLHGHGSIVSKDNVTGLAGLPGGSSKRSGNETEMAMHCDPSKPNSSIGQYSIRNPST